ncbi:MAG TPA: carboxypeptidase regulatory-like domain-containing protein [Phycisphaerae bacterium]|nr:carboxypeptidase regulatory-like domain-containing protein [Phycisphaerae bacterium]HRR86496.1 carboxypeptidase regulatory-like domain-containing protein [Phycisphaerae bacterium]
MRQGQEGEGKGTCDALMGRDQAVSRRELLASLAVAVSARAALAAVGTSRPASRPADTIPWDDPPTDAVLGRVLYDGTPPVLAPVDCSADPNCAALYRHNPLLPEDLVVSKTGGLAHVFVSVKHGLDPGRRWPVPDRPVILDQKGCLYIPHVFGVMAGQPLQILNSSKINEVPHGYPKRNPEFSFTLPKRGMSKTVVLNEPEVFRIGCDVHPWETAWCHVMAHPFFAVTDTEGRFMIRGLPAGEYELELWHEHATLGTLTRSVRIEAGRAAWLEEVRWSPLQQRQ